MNISDSQFVNIAQLYELNIDLAIAICNVEKWTYLQKCEPCYVVYIHFIRGHYNIYIY